MRSFYLLGTQMQLFSSTEHKGSFLISIDRADQFRFRRNCPPTPPLTQRLHLRLTWEKISGNGTGSWAVSRIPKLIRRGMPRGYCCFKPILCLSLTKSPVAL